MNPVAYMLKPKESLNFLLIGELMCYRDGGEPERIWHLNIYSSPKSRRIEANKMKRGSSDIIFIEWNITMEEIIKQGRYFNARQPDKVLKSDKLDIFRQIVK